MKRVRKKTSRQYNQSLQRPEELIFYANPLYPIVNTFLYFLLFLFILGSGIWGIIEHISKVDMNDIFLLFFWFLMCIFLGWRLWVAFSDIGVSKPLLAINYLGIFVYEPPEINVLKRSYKPLNYQRSRHNEPEAALLWKDIASIAVTGYLVILPKDRAIQEGSILKVRNKMSYTWMRTGDPLFVRRRHADRPFKEILQQIRVTFGSELEHFQIEMK